MMLDDLIAEYVERFNQGLPFTLVGSVSNEELIAIIKKCLQEGKPCEVDLNPWEALY